LEILEEEVLPMRLLILGKHELSHWKEIRDKTAMILDHPPLGVRVLYRYATLSGNLSFTVIEAEQEEEVAKLMTDLSGISLYEVYPIYAVGGTEKTASEEQQGPIESMHGPL
jgi:hypothetical protein